MEEVKAELTAQLENPVAFTIPVLGGIPVSQSVVVSWIIMALLTVLSLVLTRKLSRSPGGGSWCWRCLWGLSTTSAGTSSARSGGASPPGWEQRPCISPAPT